jgi:hypothetical protein
MDNNRSPIKNGRALIWLIVLVAGLLIGRWLFAQAVAVGPIQEPPWTAVAIVVVAVIALMASKAEAADDATVVVEAGPLSQVWQRVGQIVAPLRRNGRAFTLLLALILIAYVLNRIPALVLPDDSYRGVFIAWLVAFLLYLGVVTPAQFGHSEWNWQAWWQLRKREVVAVTAVLLLAFVLRAWHIETIPFTLAGDEASQGLEAIKVLNGEIRNPFATGWLGVPTMSFFFNSITIKLLGRTILGLRLPWVFVGTATVLATFLLVKQLKGRRMAFVVALLVAVYHYHIHYSRLGSNQVADPFFLSLSLLFLYRALDKQSRLDWALTGGIAGLAFYFYAGARLTAVIILAVLAYEFIRHPRQFWQQHRVGVFSLLGGFLIVGAPMFQYAMRFPGEFNARLNQVGIIQSGWLVREIDIRQESMVAILWDQFHRAALAFNFYPDRTVWYGLRQPLLDPFFGSLFLLGLGYGTLKLLGKTADARSAPMVAWWWGGMLLGGMMTESPPSSQRLVTLAVPACYFIGLALWELTQLARKSIRQVSLNGVLGLGVLVFTLVSLNTYFVEYTPQRLYGGSNAELATEIAPDLAELAPSHRLLFVGAPFMYWGFSTLPYLVDRAEGSDVTEPLTAPLSPDLVLVDKGAVFIFIPQRLGELGPVQQAFPEGQLIQYYSPVDGRLMVTLYIIPPADGVIIR